jgi:hypothetical protein
MPKFRFVIDIEASEYDGQGDFPPHVYASEAFFGILQDAQNRYHMQLIKNCAEENPATKERMKEYYEAKLAVAQMVEKSYVENSHLVTKLDA